MTWIVAAVLAAAVYPLLPPLGVVRKALKGGIVFMLILLAFPGLLPHGDIESVDAAERPQTVNVDWPASSLVSNLAGFFFGNSGQDSK